MNNRSSASPVKRVLIQSDFPLGPSRGWLTFFSNLLASNNIDFLDVNSTFPAHFSISFNHKSEHLKKIQGLGIPKANRILVMLECEAILPDMHSPSTLSQYGWIFSPSPLWARSFDTIHFNYPVLPSTSDEVCISNSARYKLGMIQRNLYSCIKGEMYTFRRRIIRRLHENGISLELRGHGWQKSSILNFFQYYRLIQFQVRKGNVSNLIFFPHYFRKIRMPDAKPVGNKLDFLSQVEVAIVIENSLNYVSEKLFDCFRAGCVPIYVGPDLSLFGIPDNLVIASPPDSEKLIDIVRNINSFDLDALRCQAQEFIRSHSRPWNEEFVLSDLSSRIAQIVLTSEKRI